MTGRITPRTGLAVLLLLMAGCGSQQAAPTPTPSDIARDAAYLRSHDFVPDRHILTSAGSETFIVFHTVCAGSTDGHCQTIEVFRSGTPAPIWHQQYAGVLDFQPISGGFSVKSLQYAANDPLCCPSLPPVTHHYVWKNGHFVEAGA